MEMLDKEMTHIPGEKESDRQDFIMLLRTVNNLKMNELFISGIFHILQWSQPLTSENEVQVAFFSEMQDLFCTEGVEGG